MDELTVKDLIAELQKLPPDLLVIMPGDNEMGGPSIWHGVFEVIPVSIEKLSFKTFRGSYGEKAGGVINAVSMGDQ